MQTSLPVHQNFCSTFLCAYTVYWISAVHYTWIGAMNLFHVMRGFVFAAHLLFTFVLVMIHVVRGFVFEPYVVLCRELPELDE